jgi:hypothetical protein
MMRSKGCTIRDFLREKGIREQVRLPTLSVNTFCLCYLHIEEASSARLPLVVLGNAYGEK